MFVINDAHRAVPDRRQWDAPSLLVRSTRISVYNDPYSPKDSLSGNNKVHEALVKVATWFQRMGVCVCSIGAPG